MPTQRRSGPLTHEEEVFHLLMRTVPPAESEEMLPDDDSVNGDPFDDSLPGSFFDDPKDPSDC